MKRPSISVFFAAQLAIAIVLAGCTYQVTGTVTDLETGEPLVDASVGMFESFLPDSGHYVEKARTDSDGHFQFRSSRTQRTFEAHAQDHQLVSEFLGRATDKTLDIKMRSIADVRGTWDATVTGEGGETRTYQFVFSEEGMSWRQDGYEFGTVPLSPRIPEIVVDDSLMWWRVYHVGRVKAELQLDESGDTMRGSVETLRTFDYACDSCNATVEAVRTSS